MARSVLFAILCCALSSAQQAGSVSGVVTNEATGASVRKVTVTLTTGAAASSATATAISAADGRFVFPGIPAGSYRLTWRADGWAPSVQGGRYVHLGPGENKTDVRLGMTPLSTISGVVVDDSGEPVLNAQVQLFRIGYPRGKPQLQPAQAAMTDDRGQYRVFDVPPGRYHMLVSIASSRMRYTAVMPATPEVVYGGQFFGGGDRPPVKPPLTISPGAHLTAIDFRVHAVAGGTLLCRLAGLPDDVDLSSVIVFLLPHESAGPAMAQTGFRRLPDGTFQMPGIAPGSYRVLASWAGPAGSYRAVQPVQVAGGSSQELTLTLSRGVEIRGRVTIDGAPAGGGFQVSLLPGDGLRPPGPPPSAAAGPDGSFVLTGVVPGVWDVDVKPIPPGSYLKSMKLGKQDVLVEEMTIGPQTKGPLEIAVSTRGVHLAGSVTAKPPLRDAPLVLVAPQGGLSSVASLYAAKLADADGKFEFDGLTPGVYKVYAFEDAEANAWFDPEFLPSYADSGVAVHLKEGEKSSVEIPLLPKAAR